MNKEECIKIMNKLGYQVNWTDTRKYITYTTPEGYKCRDIKLYEEKYTKGAMENEFRRIKEEQSNTTRKSSGTINSKDGLLFNRSTNIKGFISNETRNSGRYTSYEKENGRNKKRFSERQYKNERGYEKRSNTRDKKSILQHETKAERNGEREKRQNNENKIESRGNSILYWCNNISNLFPNAKVNNRPKLRIKGYRNLSKQAMKEYAIKKANGSGIEWEEEEM